MIQAYDQRDMTELFFPALPDKKFALKGEKCTGGKTAKTRRIFHYVNMVGEKKRIFAIGIAVKLKAFRNINFNNLPVTWQSNKRLG